MISGKILKSEKILSKKKKRTAAFSAAVPDIHFSE